MIRKIFIQLFFCILILCRLSAIGQSHCIVPQNLNTSIETSDGKSNVVLSWEQPTPLNNPAIIYGTAIYEKHVKLMTTTLNNLERGMVIDEDSLVFQCFEFFNGILYGMEAYQCATCGGGINLTYNLGIIDADEGTFDVMLGSTIEDPISMAWNPVDKKVYVTLGKPESIYEAKFCSLNLSTGIYTPIAGFEEDIIIAIDNEGICYGINTHNSKFGTMDLETGAFTEITTLPLNILTQCQNLSIDRTTNELYWAARLDGAPQCPLYKIDKTTGHLTTIGYFPKGADNQVQSFTILNHFPAKFHVYRDGERLTDQPLDSPAFIDLTLTEAGEYAYCISAIYDDGCESETICATVSICNVCQPVNNLTTNDVGGSVKLIWEYDKPEIMFDIYKNDVFLTQTPITQFIDNEINGGATYTYCITPSNQCCKPVPLCSDITCSVNVAENEFDKNIAIFPNPASGMITIIGKNITKIKLYNYSGQLIQSYTADYEKTSLDISAYPEGIYLLQIQNNENITTSKRVVMVH